MDVFFREAEKQKKMPASMCPFDATCYAIIFHHQKKLFSVGF